MKIGLNKNDYNLISVQDMAKEAVENMQYGLEMRFMEEENMDGSHDNIIHIRHEDIHGNEFYMVFKPYDFINFYTVNCNGKKERDIDAIANIFWRWGIKGNVCYLGVFEYNDPTI